MAITITANNANGDSTGIDLSAYLATFVSPGFSPVGFGYFSSSDTDFSGNQYAVTEQTNLIADATKQAIVFESGGGANSIDYDFATHIVGGDLDAISFGYGVTYSSGTDSFPLTQLDLRISGLGLVNQSGAGSTVEALLNDGRIGSITNLSNLLAANTIIFVGSTGADKIGGTGGNDSFTGGGGVDTAVFRGNRADYTIASAGVGVFTVTDNRGGSPDGVDTLTNFSFAQFADQTVLLDTDPFASNDSVTTGKNIRATINVLANDGDPDGTLDATTVTVVGAAAHGTTSVNATTGVITYSPTVGYVGTDSFTYTVKDNDGNVTNEATVNVNVAAKLTLTSADEAFVADASGVGPVEVDGGAGADYLSGSSNPSTAGADKFYGGEGNDVIFGAGGDDHLEGNDGDDILRSGSGNDTLIGGAGIDTYGIRFFRNVASATLDSGTVTIIDDDGVLWNGTPRPATIPAGWTSVPPANAGFLIAGTATVVSAGVFDLAVTDDSAATKHYALAWTGVDLTITAGNEVVTIKDYVNGKFGILLPVPVVANDSAATAKNIKATIDVLANDTDSDGTLDPSTVTVVDSPAHGSVSINTTTGVITYSPTVGYVGADSFTYTVKDNDGNVSGKATVNVNVAAKLTLTSADEAFVADASGVGPVEVDGGAGADYLSGSSNPSTAGADIFYGGEGNDVIFGAGGDDRLEGNAGDDILRSGSGNDTLIGGAGIDTYGIRFFRNVASATLDSGTVTIIDDDGVLWNGTPRPATIPAGWTSVPPAHAGFLIAGTATAVSAGVWDLAVVDDSAATKHYALGWTGGDLTVTAGNEVVTIKDYVNGTFGITLQNPTPGQFIDDTYAVRSGNSQYDAGLGTDTVTFDFRLVDATITYSGNQVIVDSGSRHAVLTGFEIFKFTDGTISNNDGDPLVDDLFYYSQNHDVWGAQVDADQHYHNNGWREGRDPSAFFDTSLYLALNSDVKAAGIDPLNHYRVSGWQEGRAFSTAFDNQKYLAANPDVAAAHIDPLAHFLQYGAQEGRQPFTLNSPITSNGFDVIYYLQTNPDVAAAGVDPFWHFQNTGWHEGRNPNALFDTAGYLAHNTDVAAAGVNPLDHYNTSGWREGRDPSLAFDTASYLAANPDVAAAGVNPLNHFLVSGIHEGRTAFADTVWA